MKGVLLDTLSLWRVHGDIASVSLFIRKIYLPKHACSISGDGKIILIPHKMTTHKLANGVKEFSALISVTRTYNPLPSGCKALERGD